MSPDKLIHMANQIARFMESKPHAEGVEGFAGHINDSRHDRRRRRWVPPAGAGSRRHGAPSRRLRGDAEAARLR